MEEFIRIIWNNQPVLTSKQLAQAYECSPHRIKDNFNRAKAYFTEGQHFFKLTGDALRQFKSSVGKKDQEAIVARSAPQLLLWTYQGCARHCKMINTPKAWEVFGEMEKVYFAVKGSPDLPPTQPALFEEDTTIENKLLKKELDALKKQLPAAKSLDFAVCYKLLMSNGLVKIGMTSNLTERTRKLKQETHLDVLDYRTTPFMSVEDAAALEEKLHARYAADCEGGEYFSIRFADVSLKPM